MSGDRLDDMTGDISGDGRWMTYAELAEHRGISRPSAERLVLRKRWRRQRGNDRTVRILVPRDSLSGDMSDGVSADTSADMSGDTADRDALLAGALATLEGALAEASKRADAALALADRLGSQLLDAGERADRAETRTAAAESDRRHGEELVANLEADLREKDAVFAEQQAVAEAHAWDAEQAARIATDALNVARRAEEARKARGRLRRAWDGWRGR